MAEKKKSGNMNAFNAASIFDYSDDGNKLSTEYGSGLEAASQPINIEQPIAAPGKYEGMGTGAVQAMNAGGSPGQIATSAGIYGLMSGAMAGPYALAGGLALSALEEQKKAEAANEAAKVKEAQDRKAAVQNALNQALGATRQLGV